MALIEGWMPPSRENWEFVVYFWQFFPVFTAIQWLTSFYPQGKTSIPSRFNLPGPLAWTLMELPGVLTVLYCTFTLPYTSPVSASLPNGPSSLPTANKTMIAIYTIHYIYRAVLSPLLLNPSMSPIHPIVFLSAAGWQLTNGISLGGWLAGYGPTNALDWAGHAYYIQVGLVIWGWAFLGNVWHDDELREMRRAALKKQRDDAVKQGKKPDAVEGVHKVYLMPRNGLFRLVLHPHYLCEWVEWAGFWMVGGLGCVPARSFLLNEISTMLPRALAGRDWYIQRFGKEAVGKKKAVIPWLV